MRFLTVCLLLFPSVGWSDDAETLFRDDVRPMLSDKCFLCHGPDESTREADLRLDRFQDAVDAGVITPGDPDFSMILDRVTSTDPDVVMPPPETGKSVSAAEAASLRTWIEAGAEYATHWAFVPPSRPEVPEGIEDWGNNPIDRFVGERLKAAGMKPSPEADAATLVRRMYLDVIGLPPRIEQLDAALQRARSFSEGPDGADAGVHSLALRARLVEELLASPHYGEKWGRWWLDAARYADSDGYEKDKPRTVWFYRDWVIKALNADKPYDAFVTEQVAGDLLPNAGQDERVATGFLRNSMVNEEGGADPEQFRVEGMFDRVDAIGKAVLGVTTQCAQCHTHKYDPLSHREYYEMFAALNDFHEATITVYTPDQRKKGDTLEAAAREIRHAFRQANPDWRDGMRAWEDHVRSEGSRWTVMRPTDIPFEGQKFRVLEDGSILSESYAPTQMDNVFKLKTDVGGITAVRVDALTHPQLPRGGPGRSIDGTGALTDFLVEWSGDDGSAQTADWQGAIADVNADEAPLTAPYLGRDPSKENRVTGPIEMAVDGDNKTAWTTNVDPFRRNRDHAAVFVPTKPIAADVDGEYTIGFRMRMKHGGWNSDDNQNYLLGRYRFSVTTDVIGDQPSVVLSDSERRILDKPFDQRTPAEEDRLFDRWLESASPETAAQLADAWSQYPEGETQLVAQALDEPRTTNVMLRGDFLSPGESVTPGVPEMLGSLPETDEPSRLRFARWLTDNPTAARVIVNRIWQAYFGRGLVETPEDFGMQSPPPSHPELLDWLAVELIDSGWSLKHIHRLIVESATYRQSSHVTSGHLESDPYNVWLSRGPRFRVNAEVVRDSALVAAGLLDRTVGGPSVYPPAPEFLFQPPASYGPKIWDVDTDDTQYRRSVYVHRFRSVLYPPLQAFDAPDAAAACVRRERSNTPLQALVLLNEAQFAEAAVALGRRMRDADGDDADKLAAGFRRVTSRTATGDETAVLLRLLEAERQSNGEDAAWTAVGRTLLNLDEAVTKE